MLLNTVEHFFYTAKNSTKSTYKHRETPREVWEEKRVKANKQTDRETFKHREERDRKRRTERGREER